MCIIANFFFLKLLLHCIVIRAPQAQELHQISQHKQATILIH